MGALREEHRVVVDVRAAVHHDDLRVGDALGVEAVDHGLGLQPAHVLVVVGHVVVRGAAEVDAVVVDDLHPGLGGLLLDADARGDVDGVEDQDLHALTDHALRDRGLLAVAATGVLHVGLEAGRRQVLLQQRLVVERVARRRGGVGQDRPDLAGGLAGVAARSALRAAGGRVVEAAGRGHTAAAAAAVARAVVGVGATGGEAGCAQDERNPEGCEAVQGCGHVVLLDWGQPSGRPDDL